MSNSARKQRRSMAPTISEIASGTVKDSKGKSCPPETVALLQELPLQSISARKGKRDWNVVKQDAEILHSKLGIVRMTK